MIRICLIEPFLGDGVQMNWSDGSLVEPCWLERVGLSGILLGTEFGDSG
jgi:hypothetical protein